MVKAMPCKSNAFTGVESDRQSKIKIHFIIIRKLVKKAHHETYNSVEWPMIKEWDRLQIH